MGEVAASPGKDRTMIDFIAITILCAILSVCIHVVVNYMIPDVIDLSKELFKTDDEYEDAIQELNLADQQFNYADQKYIDQAIYRRKAAEERIQSLVREKRVI